MKILVTGAAGFLGSHLCDRLVELRHEVIGLDDCSTGSGGNMSRFRHRLIHDVRNPFPFLLDVERIYHLACPASPVHYQKDPVRTIETALWGTRNALDLARIVGARSLVSSTSEIYGQPLEHPQKETLWSHVNTQGPRSCYELGKAAAESLCVAFTKQYGTDARIARIHNTYGPRLAEDDGRVVSNFICQALRGEPLTIYGDGSQTRSLCYVSDTVDGLIRLMEHDHNPGPVNIGNPSEVSMLQLAGIIFSSVSGRPPTDADIVHRPLPVDDPTRRCPDITKMCELLGWAPKVSLVDGLRSTVQWFRERKDLRGSFEMIR